MKKRIDRRPQALFPAKNGLKNAKHAKKRQLNWLAIKLVQNSNPENPCDMLHETLRQSFHLWKLSSAASQTLTLWSNIMFGVFGFAFTALCSSQNAKTYP